MARDPVTAKLMRNDRGDIFAVMLIEGEPWWVHRISFEELAWCDYGHDEARVFTLAQSPFLGGPQRYTANEHGTLLDYPVAAWPVIVLEINPDQQPARVEVSSWTRAALFPSREFAVAFMRERARQDGVRAAYCLWETATLPTEPGDISSLLAISHPVEEIVCAPDGQVTRRRYR